MKILNLYACLGGNRYKWDEVTDVEVTAVELDPDLARMYQERFPNDTVIIADAHQYLLDHYKEFDFIWSSPPCPTHSRARYWGSKGGMSNVVYPDMVLYQEILLLKHYYDGKYCVENVKPYYELLVPGKKRGRHIYWCNFNLPSVIGRDNHSFDKDEISKLSEFHDYDFKRYKGNQRKDKIARNLVDYEAGRTILETVVGIHRKQNQKQVSIFDHL